MAIVFTEDGIRLLHEIVRDAYKRNPDELRSLCRALDDIQPRRGGRTWEWFLDNEILPYQAKLFGEQDDPEGATGAGG